MTKLVSRYPIIFSAVVVLLAAAGIRLLGAGLAGLKLSEMAARLTIEALFCGYVVFLLTSLRWWYEAGFKRPAIRRRLWASLPLLFLPAVVMVSSGFKAAQADQVIWFALFTSMVAFSEEGLMRGVALRAMLPGGLTRAVLLSSLFFGIGHLLSLWQGYSLSVVMVQVIYSTLLGIGFAGTRLYTGTIWPPLVIHTLINFTDMASRGFVLVRPRSLTLSGAIVPIGITSLYAIYGGWLLRLTAKGQSTASRLVRPECPL